MKASPEQALRAENLLHRFLDRELSDGECDELLMLWESFPELDRAAKASFNVDASLRFFARLEKEPIGYFSETTDWLELKERKSLFRDEDFWENDLVDLDTLLRLATEANSQPALEKPKPQRAQETKLPDKSNLKKSTFKRRERTLTSAILLIIGFLGLFSWGVYNEFRPKQEPSTAFHALATVTEAIDLRFASGIQEIKMGQQLESDPIRFDSGVMELTLQNGVRLVLEGPVDFRLNTAMKTFCNTGRLSVDVPKNAKGFEVITPDMTVRDQGTRFVLDVGEAETKIHTIEGLVELDRLPTGKTELLPAGKAVEFSPEKGLSHFAANLALFFTDKQLKDRAEQRDRIMLEKAERQRQAWSNDRALLIDFDFTPEKGTVKNLAARSGEIAPARTLGGRPVTGRWGGGSAYQFGRKSDGIEIDVSRLLRSLTLSATVRIDALDRFNSALLGSREEGAGHLIWQIRNDGTLQLGIQPEKNMPLINYTVPGIISRKHWGGWYQLAIVYDGDAKSVVFYLDGRRVGKQEITTDIPIRLDQATVGNCFWKQGKITHRAFEGRFERFLLFDRALSDDEVRGLYDESP